jgi:hypothetical protein
MQISAKAAAFFRLRGYQPLARLLQVGIEPEELFRQLDPVRRNSCLLGNDAKQVYIGGRKRFPRSAWS